MRKLISNTALVAIAAGGMLFASCGDHDMFNPNYKAEEYAANWEQKIGAVDPNQDWSMATSITATFNVAAAGNGVLNIYTNNPILPSSRLLAKVFLNNGSGSATFDAVKGADQVFVVASNNGKNVVYGWADIVNGQVNAGKTVAKKAAKTRAGETCPVTIGETETLPYTKYVSEVKKTTVLVFNGTQKTLDEWKAQVKNDIANYNVNEIGYKYSSFWAFTFESVFTLPDGTPKSDVWKFPQKADPSWVNDESQWQLKSGVEETEKVEEIISPIKLTMLNNVEKKSVAQPYTLAWGFELFGPGGFFQEGPQEDGIYKYYLEPKISIKDYDITKVEQGFSITSKGGEISLPFIYGATKSSDRFGYIYYKDGQDPLTQPHYIIMNDSRPYTNIYFDSWQGTVIGSDGMELANWAKDGTTSLIGYDKETLVWGTEYKLAFFGDSHDQAATYNFPAGYHIVFFIDNPKDNHAGYNYSLPELNLRINHKDLNSDNKLTYDENRGAIKATAWTYNDMTFLGFEDGGGDEDLNDIVFWVEGDFTPDQENPEVPSTTTPQERVQSWILACEDLGSTDDYDFNDIVLEVKKTENTEDITTNGTVTATNFKSAKLQVRCLAAGGTYQANISYDNGRVSIGESHALLGRPGSSDMLNTKALDCPFSEWITLEETTSEDEWTNIQNANSWSIDNIAGKIQIVVTSDEKTGTAALISAPTTGEAPQMIIVPGDWQWPTERAHIEEAYPDFKNWNSNASFTDWYNTKVANNVIAR